MIKRSRCRHLLGFVAAGTLAVAASPTPAAGAAPDTGPSVALQSAVTPDGLSRHLVEFQRTATARGGNRAAGSKGYDASADYAARMLRQAGYRVTRPKVSYGTFRLTAPSLLRRSTPAPAATLAHTVLAYSGSGDVRARVTLPRGSALGCAPSDFGAANARTIVVVRRGTCLFGTKARNADRAGAAGIVVYNSAPGALTGTLGDEFTLDIPAVGVTQAIGRRLVAAVPRGLTLQLRVAAARDRITTSNVIAESRSGDPSTVVMAGAHLDSVPAGPGINDNGSGSAAVLEVARQLSRVPETRRPKHRVRFALWGAEEAGLVGSTQYLARLAPPERAKIKLYLNFDMIASPNFARFVYDGDNSDGVGAGPGPRGSAAIERLFVTYFASRGLRTAGTDFDGRSDYGPFMAAGIPSGGLFTGAEEIKTPAQARAFGGRAGVRFDRCYHMACDRTTNVSATALHQNADALAHAIATYSRDLSSVTGAK